MPPTVQGLPSTGAPSPAPRPLPGTETRPREYGDRDRAVADESSDALEAGTATGVDITNVNDLNTGVSEPERVVLVRLASQNVKPFPETLDV